MIDFNDIHVTARVQEIARTQASVADEWMRKANVVGLGVGLKERAGRLTDEISLCVFVSHKLPAGVLDPHDLVQKTKTPPKEVTEAIKGAEGRQISTDVVEVGQIFAGEAHTGNRSLTGRMRPAMGGFSVGHRDITAGTIATAVYDRPRDGYGIPRSYYILSNNHVLANTNAGNLGDPILQPGPYDGGTLPGDVIGHLSRFVPIELGPSVPLDKQRNLVDAAMAEVSFEACDRKIYWIGYLNGWRTSDDVPLGLLVQKTGRTTNYTTGKVSYIHATVDVNYGGGRTARFRDQILTTEMSAPGDSGSLISDLDGRAVGLLFAGSNRVTVANYIEHVQNLLNIVIAENP
jgi:S1-C subfamily serine protease